MLTIPFVLSLIGLIASHGYGLAPPEDVRIDYYKVSTTRDLVINTARPRFSWKLPSSSNRNVQQTAYEIQIRSDDDQFVMGPVQSSQSIHVLYSYPRNLQALTHYQVRIRVWTSDSKEASRWTSWMKFRTSIFDLHHFLLNHNDEVNWIGSTQIYMNELRKEFNVSIASSIRTATVFISGIGYYELYLNGQSVDASRKLDPGWTTYEKRTLFVSYDLTSTVKPGMNAVGVKLGNGWYSQEQYVPPSTLEPNYGKNKTMILERPFDNILYDLSFLL